MKNIKNGREYLQYVLKCLNNRLAQADAAILEGEKEIEDMHEYYWENYTEMDQYGYEDYDNQQALFRQMNANEEQFRLRKRFKKMQDSPFFGRVMHHPTHHRYLHSHHHKWMRVVSRNRIILRPV